MNRDLRETLHDVALDLEGLAVELDSDIAELRTAEHANWARDCQSRVEKIIRDLDHSGSAISSHVHYTRLANGARPAEVAS